MRNKRTFVMGDIHGGYRSLMQCLERSGFDYENDTLIQLGDIVDGWPDTVEVVDELLEIKNLISICGNHDLWFIEFLREGVHPIRWTQGGEGTLRSYCDHFDGLLDSTAYGFSTSLRPDDIPKEHKDFFLNQKPYYIDDKMNLFVHGGFNRDYYIDDPYANDLESVLAWDRELWQKAMSSRRNGVLRTKDNFNEIFIGHTTTGMWKYTEDLLEPWMGKEMIGERIDTPIHACNIWNLDTGGGWEGKLTIMNVDTKEYWQSDKLSEVYKGIKGRV
jgi:serine/threonine protein phosphatase 1